MEWERESCLKLVTHEWKQRDNWFENERVTVSKRGDERGRGRRGYDRRHYYMRCGDGRQMEGGGGAAATECVRVREPPRHVTGAGGRGSGGQTVFVCCEIKGKAFGGRERE